MDELQSYLTKYIKDSLYKIDNHFCKTTDFIKILCEYAKPNIQISMGRLHALVLKDGTIFNAITNNWKIMDQFGISPD